MNVATTEKTPSPQTQTPRQSTLSGNSGLWMAKRKFANGAMWFFGTIAAIMAVVPLGLVLWYVVSKGLAVLTPDFFTQVQAPPGEPGGGMKHSIIGTLVLIGIASCIGLPFGILGGIYLSEYGNNRFGWTVRFAADVLNGVPSIVIGIFVYAIAILPQPADSRNFSAWAGGLALGIMMIPTIMRTTEEIVRLVPMSQREAALALGDTRWHTTMKVVLSSARGGVITGVLLALARVAGETAPLLFTALGNSYLSTNPNEPIDALPVRIYVFATAADDRWNALAWGGALVLVLMVLILSIAARYFTRNLQATK
jgi:phosphate transport system permease protein